MKRGTVVAYAFVLLLISINGLYALFDIGVFSELGENWYLAGASAAWFIGYVYVRGDTWGDSAKPSKVLMVASWGLLIGMAYTDAVPNLIDQAEAFGYLAGAIHTVSFWSVSWKRLGR